ncbi:MAG: MBL fold metallo-hydrolase [Phascolarctobacterium faecium]
MPTTFKFINHACFTMTHEGHTIIFDPYLDGSTQDINDLKVEYIFVSHGHFDHLGSAIELAKACNATIISTAEVCGVVSEAGVENHAMHLGGTHEFPFGKVRLTLAFHACSVHACGFIVISMVLNFILPAIPLFGDMQLLQRLDAFNSEFSPLVIISQWDQKTQLLQPNSYKLNM